jgi:hypothetical protein
MTVLTTSLDRRSEAFRGYDAAMRGLAADLRAKLAKIEEGAGRARDEFHLAATAQNLRKPAMLIPVPAPTSAT